MPPVAATLPAASDAKLVGSRFPTSPWDAISWPSLSTRKTTLAEESIRNRARTAFIWWYCCSRNRIGVSAIVRLFIEGRGGMFPGELNSKRLFRGLQVFETKRGYLFGWGSLPRWIKPPYAEKHFNIANNDHQVFFFVCTFVKSNAGFSVVKHPQIVVFVDLEACLW